VHQVIDDRDHPVGIGDGKWTAGAEVILDIDDHESRVHAEIASGIVDGALDGRSLIRMIGHRLWMAKKPFADGRTASASRQADPGTAVAAAIRKPGRPASRSVPVALDVESADSVAAGCRMETRSPDEFPATPKRITTPARTASIPPRRIEP
jgi:hypothetical protein